jgi:hypothetical protein
LRRENQKRLDYHQRRDAHFALLTKRKINSFKSTLRRQYGFIANPSMPIWQNIQNILISMSTSEYFYHPSNKAVHLLINKSLRGELPPRINPTIRAGAQLLPQESPPHK